MTADHAYRSIWGRLAAVRRRIVALEAAVLATRMLGALLAFLLLNMLVGLLAPPVLFLRGAALLSLLAALAYVGLAGLRFVRGYPRIDWIAAEVERASPDLRGDLLRGALDLWRRRDDARFGYSPELIEALVQDALRKSAAIRERTIAGAKDLRRALPLLPLLAGALALLFAFLPERTTAVARALLPASRERLIQEMGLEVRPGDCRIEPGETVPVEASFGGYRGDAPLLLVRRGDAEPATYPMAEAPRGVRRVFEAATPPLSEDASYSVRFDGGASPWYSIRVHHPPLLADVEYTLVPPPHTGLIEETVRENHGNVRAPVGTEVRLRAVATRAVREGRLDREGMEPIPLRADGTRVSGAFVVDRPFTYRIRLADEEGGENPDPVAYRVVPVEDENPFVRLLEPAEDLEIGASMKLRIRFSALDDYGVARVNLVFRKGEDEEERKILFFETSQRVAEIEREKEWDLSDLNLFPQETVVYFLEAWDNDAVRGPKRGVSETRALRMPSVAEILAEASEDQEEEIADLEEIREQGEEIEKKLDDLAREISRSEETPWEEKKKIEGILEKQKEIEESLREVSSEVEKTTQALEENRLVTPETLERMMELSRLLSEVATDEMRKAMEQLQAAMRDLKPEEVRAAAENLDLTQKDFLERLDRAIEMLKRLKSLQDADALAAAFQKLAEEQRELRERSSQAGSGETEKLAREEESLRRELDRLGEQAEDAARRAGETSPEISRMIEEALAELDKNKTGSAMSRSAEDLRAGRKREASEAQQKAENDLFDLAFRLSEQVAGMCTASQKKAAAAFGESIQDLLYLSERQEEVVVKAERVKPSAPIQTRRSLAEREQEISAGIGRIMEKIRVVGREVPELSSYVLDMLRRARERAEEAATGLEEGRIDLARARADEAMRQVNRSVVELLRSQESHSSSCNNPNSQGQGGLQKMQQMTDQQRGLNQETSRIPIPSANPSSIPVEARAQMARLAAEQQQIRKGLDELQQEVEEGGEVVGKLDQILEDMRQVERDLERAELSPETREKQEKILSRMLDAQRSIRERGYRRDRRSRSGTETPAASPEDVPRTLTEMRERVKEDPVREQGLVVPPEYEELIRSYYRSLTGEK